MESKVESPEEYIQTLPEDRKKYFEKLRNVILKNIPEGFVEEMSYWMIGYVVPHSTYPGGYHCNPELPLPFMSIANQKWFIALYNSWIYADSNLKKWFEDEYAKVCKYKLDMWKCCIRFKKMEDIPYDLIANLVTKMSVEEWIELYEKRNKK